MEIINLNNINILNFKNFKINNNIQILFNDKVYNYFDLNSFNVLEHGLYYNYDLLYRLHILKSFNFIKDLYDENLKIFLTNFDNKFINDYGLKNDTYYDAVKKYGEFNVNEEKDLVDDLKNKFINNDNYIKKNNKYIEFNDFLKIICFILNKLPGYARDFYIRKN